MIGLRKRVSIGFLSIVILLSISGMIAFVELNNLSTDTEEILNINKHNMELTRSMLQAAQDQDRAFVQMTIFSDASFDSLGMATIASLEESVSVADEYKLSAELVDSLSGSINSLKKLANKVISLPDSDSLRITYFSEYLPIKDRVKHSIYNYMTSSAEVVEPRAEMLQRNAYRAVTPVFLSLIVMIVIVIMLYYFMVIYCVNPIIKMNRSLGDFIMFKLPFSVNNSYGDEVGELQEKIETVTTQLKKREANE